jgi:putative ABC transport system permease protein
MRAVEVARSALRSLRSNRLRTGLTALGTIIGVASVVIVLSVGEGARVSVEERIRALGTNLLTVRPGAGGFGPVRVGTVNTLTLEDARAIAELPGVRAVAPQILGSAQVRHLTENVSAQVVGVTEAYFAVKGLDIASGLGITEMDDATRARVAVLGTNVARDLFVGQSPLGETVQIRGIAFRVIGVLAAVGDAGWESPDDVVIVPLATHSGVLFGVDTPSMVNVQVVDESANDRTIARITALLRLRHALREDEDDDFSVRSQTEMREAMSSITGTLTALLGAVALVSLVVGGIGIMNIMLASVQERTREIGVRMAVGARRRDILVQFLLEAVVVSLVGGLTGVVVGVACAAAIASFGGWTTVVPLYGVALALFVSVLVGVVFGVGPARRAAALDPVEALRAE